MLSLIHISNALYLIGGENDDLIQEGMIGLFKAVRDYKSDKEASFYSFAQLCIDVYKRQVYVLLWIYMTGDYLLCVKQLFCAKQLLYSYMTVIVILIM